MKSLPEIGDLAPAFEAESTRGTVRFPEYCEGKWCILFAHPANFTSAWEMFSAFLYKKERWLDERQAKVIGISNVSIRPNDWLQVTQRYVGIYLRGPVIEDFDCQIAKMYGIASGRRPLPDCDRLALIIDPAGIVRLIIHRPLPNIEEALLEIQRQFEEMSGIKAPTDIGHLPFASNNISEQTDVPKERKYNVKPAYFKRKRLPDN
jgi:peroxiredoxin 2/4